MNIYLIKLLIEIAVLITLWRISVKIDAKLTFLKKDIEYLEKDTELLMSKLGLDDAIDNQLSMRDTASPILEPSFKQKKAAEEKRIINLNHEGIEVIPKNWDKLTTKKFSKKGVKK